MTGSLILKGSFSSNQVAQVTASYALRAITASYALSYSGTSGTSEIMVVADQVAHPVPVGHPAVQVLQAVVDHLVQVVQVEVAVQVLL